MNIKKIALISIVSSKELAFVDYVIVLYFIANTIIVFYQQKSSQNLLSFSSLFYFFLETASG